MWRSIYAGLGQWWLSGGGIGKASPILVFFINTENYEYEQGFQLTKEALKLENVDLWSRFQFDGLYSNGYHCKKGNSMNWLR
jgi:hypothetical protein